MSEETMFDKKWAKVLKDLSDFKEIADAASTEDLKKIILSSENNISTIEKAKEKDEKLNAAKEIVKEFSIPYRDSMKVQMCKIKYAVFLLDQNGVDLSPKD